MIIYKVTNKINGKIYIGSTSLTFNRRKYYHFYDAFKKNSQKYFHRALRKYGKENFNWKILKEVNVKKEMLELEHKYIKKFNSYKKGYNLTLGFDNTTLGYKFTEEQKKYLSEKNKGHNNPNYGNKWTKKQKMEASKRQKENHKHLIGKNCPSKRLEVRKKLSEGKLGNKNPKSHKWLITYPNGKKIILYGGIKRFLKENNLTYMKITPMLKGKKDNYKGWIIKKMEGCYVSD